MHNKYKHIVLLSIFTFVMFAAVPLPVHYDLRNVQGNSYVSAVRSQQGGTCWAHGVMAAIESNMMKSGQWNSNVYVTGPDLSEYHLDWWNGFNLFYNQDIGYDPTWGLTVHMGGDYRVAAAYLSRGDGAVPHENASSYESPPARRDISYTYYYPRTVIWYQLKDDLSNIDRIKRVIMDHGAIGTCMYADNIFLNDSTNGSFYQPPSDLREPNHAVAIAGWNDTITTAAPAPGAWLCKNSWGENWGSEWGESGYFWISYYDKHAGRDPEMGCVSFREVEEMKYDSIYYHDYHGWRDTLDVQEASNVFMAEARDTLLAVSFFTASDSIDYIVGVFRTWDDLINEDPVTAQYGIIPYAGFHTVDLDNKIVLTEGDSFYVYLYLDKGGHAYDRTSIVPVLLNAPPLYKTAVPALTTVPSTASPNESFFKQNGQWLDLQTVNITANFCIKALVKKGKISLQEPSPDASSLLGIYPNPSNSRIVVDLQLSHSADVNITLFDLRGRRVSTVLNKTLPKGYRWFEFDLSDLSGGIYICILNVDGKTVDTEKVLLIK